MSKKIVEHGKSKMISSYGGVGSIVETIDNSVLIETFDNWGYFDLPELEKYIIKDDRLRSRLKSRFEQLSHIVRVPEFKRGNSDNYILFPRANYFPKWFYCTNYKCNRLDTYDTWKAKWIASGKDLDKFYPPKCNNPECNEKPLEQVRFVMTCTDGHLEDLPWQYWPTYTDDDTTGVISDDDSDLNQNTFRNRIKLDYSNPNGCCDSPDLRYRISRENSELSGISIFCKNPNCTSPQNGRTLKGIFNFRKKCFGKRYWIGKNAKTEICHAGDRELRFKNSELKVVIKSSNSVYYSNIISSIYIPIKQNDISEQIRVLIGKWIERGKSQNQIIDDLFSDYDIPKAQTDAYLKTGDSKNISENDFRQEEFNFLLSKEEEYYEIPFLKFSRVELNNQIAGFDKIIRLDRLKQTSVQVSFTRQEPLDVDSILSSEDDTQQYTVKRQSTSSNNINTTILPGVESYGEGLLFVLNSNDLNIWAKKKEVLQRVNVIKSNASNSERTFLRNRYLAITPQLILIHTLSHILIKELEYICGYPAASLRERLYIGKHMNGFLIMAIEGSEGSLGGLVSQSNDIQNLKKIIKSALKRSEDCSSDPVCYYSEGQGVSNLNLAACHSCTLLPETSCEEFNCFLDRKLLIEYFRLHNYGN